MSAGRIAVLVGGIVLALMGLAFAAGGGVALVSASGNGDSDGYLTTPTYELTTEGFAVATGAADLRGVSDEWVPWTGRLDTRITASAAEGGQVFVGIARTEDVAAYLDEVPHSRVVDLGSDPRDVEYQQVEGSSSPEPPGGQDFWVATAEGGGTQRLDWRPTDGRWSAVLMNADASPGVALAASGGVATALLWPIGAALIVGGVLLLTVGAALLIVATAGRENAHRASEPVPPTPAGHGVYPVSVEGYIDEPLRRWLWLVKWLLAVPHFVVLGLLWMAFSLLTLVAGFAILFTGRYPRSIFDFNVGVLRWTWRVAYYCSSVLGTDRYPPFSLAAVDYPASFDVEYPQRLSRGLVLVKWWLLAIPHYLVVGILVGGAVSWSVGDRAGDNWQAASSGGLIGVLAFVAGVVLLVTARYPRGLFDLLMGLNRWVYRVIAYAALMTDAYPPFRLDSGGSEPPRVPPPPTAPGGGHSAQKELLPQ